MHPCKRLDRPNGMHTALFLNLILVKLLLFGHNTAEFRHACLGRIIPLSLLDLYKPNRTIAVEPVGLSGRRGGSRSVLYIGFTTRWRDNNKTERKITFVERTNCVLLIDLLPLNNDK